MNEGDEILVQVIKDPIGTKGARLTTFVALPSRYLVYMPRGEGIGVSARIEDEAERARLKRRWCSRSRRRSRRGGYIVRTAAQGATRGGAARGHASTSRKLWQHVRGARGRTRGRLDRARRPAAAAARAAR